MRWAAEFTQDAPVRTKGAELDPRVVENKYLARVHEISIEILSKAGETVSSAHLCILQDIKTAKQSDRSRPGHHYRQLQQFLPQKSRANLRDHGKENWALVSKLSLTKSLPERWFFSQADIRLINFFSSYDVDIRDRPALDQVFAAHKGKIACVIHCAGLKAVGESGKVLFIEYAT
jgi:hypothetical protein